TDSEQRVEWVVGKPSEFNFEKLLSESDSGSVPRHWTVWDNGAPNASAQALFSSIGSTHSRVAAYLGHGSTATWSTALFNSRQAPQVLQDVRATLLLSLSCRGGSFDDAFSDSLAESWARLPDTGAQAVLALSGLAPPEEQLIAGQVFVGAAVGQGETLG